MFTGIITNLGKLAKKDRSILTFNADPAFCQKINKGRSVAVNGACLTVFKTPTSHSFSAEIMPETLHKTMLGYLKPNDPVNLELPATPATFLSGHIVQGHVDGISKLLDIERSGNSRILKLSTVSSFAKYLIKKGSVAVNGISLTVIKSGKNYFTVGIIPYTWDNTMLSTIKIGDFVNIEADILAKYAERLTK